jgi:hypothetical protein
MLLISYPDCKEHVNLMNNAVTGTFPELFSSLKNLSECYAISSPLCSITSHVLAGEPILDLSNLERNMMCIICELAKWVRMTFLCCYLMDLCTIELTDCLIPSFSNDAAIITLSSSNNIGTIPTDLGELTQFERTIC